jgi:hypothetical protein
MKKHLIRIFLMITLGSLLVSKAAYVQQDEVIAPELKLAESDFSYENYKQALEFIKRVLKKVRESKKLDWETENIGIPNNLLQLDGYGLFSQRDMLRLKLENAQLRGVNRQVITDIKQRQKDIEKKIEFLLKSSDRYD